MYEYRKGFDRSKPPKSEDEKFCTGEQVRELLAAIVNEAGPLAGRDHALIFLAYHLGLRVGEVVLLERKHFTERRVEIPTLKIAPRLPCVCGSCRRRFRVSIYKAGTEHPCPRCSNPVKVPRGPKGAELVPAIALPFVEPQVLAYIREYLAVLPLEQSWLFVGQGGEHLGAPQAARIFNHYAAEAGLSPKLSFHSLRHGRGVALWRHTKDLAAVQRALRHQRLGTSEIYVHLDPERRQEYEQALNQVVVT